SPLYRCLQVKMPVYFIHSEQIKDNKVKLDDRLAHHLRNVLRLKVGETLFLVDERPRRYLTRVTASSPDRLVLAIEKEEAPPEENRSVVRLGIGILKGEKMDWVIQKATELGVSRISPLVTQRVIARPRPERLDHQQNRWEKIAAEAAQQSGRWEIPKIDSPSDLPTLLADTAPSVFKFIFSPEVSHGSIRKSIQSSIGSSSFQGTLLIGPEGGWETTEVAEAAQKGYLPISLGTRMLRSETAALVALSIIQYEVDNKRMGMQSDGNH
ncbi:MAG: 16S rRNA (uracil(1498)-N(3))-methyltransferase, partial [Nitrospiria bacterium]